jgi:hypothetical protein
MKTTARKHDAERRYSFEEYLKHFTPASQSEERREYTDEPEEIGRRIVREALKELKKNLQRHLSANK